MKAALVKSSSNLLSDTVFSIVPLSFFLTPELWQIRLS
jgi:hypothetical protein